MINLWGRDECYVWKDESPYMFEEDKEKLVSLCKDTGENWLRKLEQMTDFAFAYNADDTVH